MIRAILNDLIQRGVGGSALPAFALIHFIMEQKMSMSSERQLQRRELPLAVVENWRCWRRA